MLIGLHLPAIKQQDIQIYRRVTILLKSGVYPQIIQGLTMNGKFRLVSAHLSGKQILLLFAILYSFPDYFG
jgi:hypothetical protein